MPLLQYRHGPTVDWVAANPVLLEGEPGYDDDTGEYKIGNGSDHWLDLEPYSSGGSGAPGPTGPAGPQGPAGTNGVNGGAGPQGIQGVAGTNGTNGATGPAGPAGTVNYSTLGRIDRLYIVGTGWQPRNPPSGFTGYCYYLSAHAPGVAQPGDMLTNDIWDGKTS